MISVKKHKRKGRSVKAHGRRDKWPPVKTNGSTEYLMRYKSRLLKEIDAFKTGKLHVIAGHEGHPAFIHRRLKQVLTQLKKR